MSRRELVALLVAPLCGLVALGAGAALYVALGPVVALACLAWVVGFWLAERVADRLTE